MLYWPSGHLRGLELVFLVLKLFQMLQKFLFVGVSSLEGLAYNIKKEGLIVSLIDAKNENVYFSMFNHIENKYEKIEDFKADNIYKIIDILNKYNDKEITIVGDGSEIYKKILSENLKNVKFASNIDNIQTSVSIGKASHDKYIQGIKGDSNSLVPLYLRKSQAERALNGEK